MILLELDQFLIALISNLGDMKILNSNDYLFLLPKFSDVINNFFCLITASTKNSVQLETSKFNSQLYTQVFVKFLIPIQVFLLLNYIHFEYENLILNES